MPTARLHRRIRLAPIQARCILRGAVPGWMSPDAFAALHVASIIPRFATTVAAFALYASPFALRMDRDSGNGPRNRFKFRREPAGDALRPMGGQRARAVACGPNQADDFNNSRQSSRQIAAASRSVGRCTEVPRNQFGLVYPLVFRRKIAGVSPQGFKQKPTRGIHLGILELDPPTCLYP